MSKPLPNLESPEDLIAFWDDMIAELRGHLACVDKSEDYVVTCNGIFTEITHGGASAKASNYKDATLLTRELAERYAPGVVNGNGVRGVAVRYVDALEQMMIDLENHKQWMVERLEKGKSIV